MRFYEILVKLREDLQTDQHGSPMLKKGIETNSVTSSQFEARILVAGLVRFQP